MVLDVHVVHTGFKIQMSTAQMLNELNSLAAFTTLGLADQSCLRAAPTGPPLLLTSVVATSTASTAKMNDDRVHILCFSSAAASKVSSNSLEARSA